MQSFMTIDESSTSSAILNFRSFVPEFQRVREVQPTVIYPLSSGKIILFRLPTASSYMRRYIMKNMRVREQSNRMYKRGVSE